MPYFSDTYSVIERNCYVVKPNTDMWVSVKLPVITYASHHEENVLHRGDLERCKSFTVGKQIHAAVAHGLHYSADHPVLEVIYDPIRGVAHSDHNAVRLVDIWLATLLFQTSAVYSVSTSNVINVLRVAVRRERIDPQKLRIIYQKPADFDGPERDIPIKVYRSGGLSPWPEGFCDIDSECYLNLL